MKTILNMQADLVKALGMKSKPGAIVPLEFLSAAIGLSVEAAEVLDELNRFTRPWKRDLAHQDPSLELKKEELDTTTLFAIEEETIDVLFYTLEIFYLLGMTPENIESEYKRKYVKNLARILDKTDKKEREDAIVGAKMNVFGRTQACLALKLLVDLGLEITEDVELRLIFEPRIVLYEFADRKFKVIY